MSPCQRRCILPRGGCAPSQQLKKDCVKFSPVWKENYLGLASPGQSESAWQSFPCSSCIAQPRDFLWWWKPAAEVDPDVLWTADSAPQSRHGILVDQVDMIQDSGNSESVPSIMVCFRASSEMSAYRPVHGAKQVSSFKVVTQVSLSSPQKTWCACLKKKLILLSWNYLFLAGVVC